MKKRPSLHALIFLAALLSTDLTPGLLAQTVIERIQVQAGPEDMVLDTVSASPRLLISCCGRRESDKPYGEIVSLDLHSARQEVMPRLNEPEGIVFEPHGIYLDGDLLYVISHEKEPDYHPVLVYRVRGGELHFTELIHTDKQHSPNALVTGEKGEIYITNDAGKRGKMIERILRLKRASVAKLSKNTQGEWEGETVAEDSPTLPGSTVQETGFM